MSEIRSDMYTGELTGCSVPHVWLSRLSNRSAYVSAFILRTQKEATENNQNLPIYFSDRTFLLTQYSVQGEKAIILHSFYSMHCVLLQDTGL